MNKVKVKLSGTDGNVFALLGRCASALRRAGLSLEADKLVRDVKEASDYNHALRIMMEAVDVE